MRQQIIELISIDGVVSPSRCRESYIIKNNVHLHEYIKNFNDDRPFKECLKMIINDDDGLCVVCDKPTKMKGNGKFTETCSKECGYIHRTEGVQPNKVVIPIEELDYLYNVAKLQPSIIGELYDTTNVTVVARLDEYGIQRRTHSEQQSLYSSGCDVWNYNGFDRDKANDIEFLKAENETKAVSQIAAELGCSERKIFSVFEMHDVPRNKKFKISYPEQILHTFLESLNVEFEYSKLGILSNNKELDIYIPSMKLAIEVDGVYWHSELFKDKNYHLAKTIECESLGIQLLHFWDFEIHEKIDIVKSMILAKLGRLPNRISARKCVVRDVTYNDAQMFIIDNHIQGAATSKINKGLYYNDELVCIGTFMKPRFDKDGYDYELIRFCNKLNTVVVGGISRILKVIDGSIMSYANRRFSVGAAYDACGFEKIKETKPGFFYYNNKSGDRKSRYSDLKPLIEMHDDGYARVWDCGNIVYSKK